MENNEVHIPEEVLAELQAKANGHDYTACEDGYVPKVAEQTELQKCDDCIWSVCNYNKVDWEHVEQTESKRGEWILLEPRYPIEQKVYWNKEQALADTKGNGAIERRKCSCCGYTKSFMCHMKDEQIKLWNFCPNCGADMRGDSRE